MGKSHRHFLRAQGICVLKICFRHFALSVAAPALRRDGSTAVFPRTAGQKRLFRVTLVSENRDPAPAVSGVCAPTRLTPLLIC